MLLNDDIIAFANQEMSNVVLSVDGRKEVHDRMRPLAGGQGSYDLVIPKFKKVAESRNQTNYYVRGTFTHFNKDFAADVCHLADLGFEQISIEPVVAPENEDYALTKDDIPELLAEYDKLAVELIRRHKEGKGVNFFHFMIDLEGGPCVYNVVRMWFGYGVFGGHTVGGFLPLSSVCRAGQVLNGKCGRGDCKYRYSRGISVM